MSRNPSSTHHNIQPSDRVLRSHHSKPQQPAAEIRASSKSKRLNNPNNTPSPTVVTRRRRNRKKMNSGGNKNEDDSAYFVSGSMVSSDSQEEDEEEMTKNMYEMHTINGDKYQLLTNGGQKEKDHQVGFSYGGGPRVQQESEDESFWSIMVQVFIPFLIAGMGMVAAGCTLDLVQHWRVFNDVPEVFILVPALLGLKGNLEMTMSSRLSTQANLGNMDTLRSQWHMSVGNLSLIQCQAIVIGFLASVAAVVFGWIPDGHFDKTHALVLCTSSVVTASIASFVLGLVMILVILASRHCKINPDNVATPIAASLGDLTTLALLAFIASSVYETMESHKWLCPAILVGYLFSMPCWIILTSKNKLTRKVLYSGWTPVLSAMMISSLGGLILDFTVKRFAGVAVFQPVINGVGGNLVAVQASRISTSFHQSSKLGVLPGEIQSICSNPWTVFFSKGGHARTARALMLMVVPGHLIFTYTISYVQAGHTSITPIFVIFYLLAAFIQVVLLLYIAEVLIQYLWLNKIDPDDSAIPYLTALGDVLGTALLALAFFALYSIGDRDADVGD